MDPRDKGYRPVTAFAGLCPRLAKHCEPEQIHSGRNLRVLPGAACSGLERLSAPCVRILPEEEALPIFGLL
jgi:hypothetical protein